MRKEKQELCEWKRHSSCFFCQIFQNGTEIVGNGIAGYPPYGAEAEKSQVYNKQSKVCLIKWKSKAEK